MDEYADNFLIFAKNPFLTGEWNPALVLDFIKSPILGTGVYRYSTANYILLGMIIEKVAGKPLNDLLRQNFFTPLGLGLSLCPQDDVDYAKISHPHCYPGTVDFVFGGGTVPIDVTQALSGDFIPITGKTVWAGGGIVGNAPDAAKWIRTLYAGDVLSEAAKTRIFDSMADYEEGMSGDDSFGLCGRTIFADGKKCYGSYGRSVGSNNLAFCCPEKEAGIAILTSCNENRDGNPNLDALLSLLLAALPSK